VTPERDVPVAESALRAMRVQGATAFWLRSERPDRLIRNNPAVDFLADGDDGTVLAIEHTRIEPYDGFLADWKLADERLGSVRERLEGRLPPDSVFDLSLEPASTRWVSRGDTDAIAAWVEQTAPRLRPPPRHFARCPIETCRASLTLYRWPAEGQPRNPQLRYRIGIDTDQLPAWLKNRCRRAMTTKLPKLEQGRTAHGARYTLLCLELSDRQLTDPFRLTGVLRAAADGLPVPDFVLVVMLGYDDLPLMSWTYREEGRWLDRPRLWSPDMSPPQEADP
jgi:hypothetical protein